MYFFQSKLVNKQFVNPTVCSIFDKGYRFGFNGQEKDNEVAGSGNINTAEFWEYDCRLGRRWNIDPLASMAPDWSSYRVFFCNPNIWIDPKGLFEKRRDAKKYRKENNIDGEIHKNKDGTFSIRDRLNRISYRAGDDSGPDAFLMDRSKPNDGVIGYIMFIGKKDETTSTSPLDFVGIGLGTAEYKAYNPKTWYCPIQRKSYNTSKFYGNQYTANQSTMKAASKWLNRGGSVLGIWGYYSNYDSYTKGEYNSSMIGAKSHLLADEAMNTVGFIPVYGTIFSGSWSLGKSFGPFALYNKYNEGGGKSDEELEEERLYIESILNIR